VSVTSDQLGERLRALYDKASFGGDSAALLEGAAEIKAAQAQLALGRGRFLHAQFLLDHEKRPEQLEQLTMAVKLFGELTDQRGEAEATFWMALYHQVVCGDEATAVPLLERAQLLAAAADDPLMMSYVVRHLGFVDMNARRFEGARGNFEESVRLRRQIGFLPGVGAGLLALAELAVITGDRAGAQRLLQQASNVAAEAEATGVLQWISQVREEHALD
jgi:hypothetical protein